jgi:hypothetical protein
VRQTIYAVVAAGIAALTAPPSLATTVLPPGSSVDGQSIADWTAAWWTRFWQAPSTSIDPATGNISAAVNNNGPVFFGPTTNGDPGLITMGPVTIKFSAPYGTPILLPILPFEDLEAASIDPPSVTVADRENAASVVVAGWLGSVDTTSLFASIDGTPVPNPSSYLEQTGLFSAGPTQAGSLAAGAGVAVGDDLYPIDAAGYWLMIEGLTPGEHTVDFSGSSGMFTPDPNCCTNFPIGPFGIDVTWNIDVVPEPDSALLMLSGLGGMLILRRNRTR